MYELHIVMKSGTVHYYIDEEATEVFKAIDMAQSRGTDWARIKNKHGQLIYVLNNIETIRYSLMSNNMNVH